MGQLTNLNWCRIPSILSANLGVLSFNKHYCWWFRNPANSPVEVGSFSHYLKGFSTIPVWMFGISKPSTVIHGIFMKLWEMLMNVLWFSNLNHLPSDVFNFIENLFYHIFSQPQPHRLPLGSPDRWMARKGLWSLFGPGLIVITKSMAEIRSFFVWVFFCS